MHSQQAEPSAPWGHPLALGAAFLPTSVYLIKPPWLVAKGTSVRHLVDQEKASQRRKNLSPAH